MTHICVSKLTIIGSDNGLSPGRRQAIIWTNDNILVRAAQFSFRPADFLPLHFGLNFRNPSYIYIRACCIIYICSLYHSVHKFTVNNPDLCIIGLEIFNWKDWFDNLLCHLVRPWRTSPPSPPLCAALILVIEPLGTNFSEISIEINTFSFKKMPLKMSSGKWRPFCLGLNVLTHWPLVMLYDRTLSVKFQIMAWCLTAPRHYLTQCGIIMTMVPWHLLECYICQIYLIHSPKGSFKGNTWLISDWQNLLDNYIHRIIPRSPRGQDIPFLFNLELDFHSSVFIVYRFKLMISKGVGILRCVALIFFVVLS